MLPGLPAADIERFDILRPGESPRSDLLLEISTESGRRWLAALRKPMESVRQALTAVYPTPSPSTLCAVVGGDAVLIDVEHPGRHEWLETGGPVVAVRPLVAEGLLLLATPWSITALDSSGQLWQTQRLAIDGLRMDEVADGLLAGVADPDDMEPRDFAVDLQSGHHEGGTPTG